MKTRRAQAARIAIAVAIWLMIPTLLSAHAKLQKTQPANGTTVSAAPKEVQLWFDEDVDLKVSKIGVTGPAGAVAVGPTRLMGPKSLIAVVTGPLTDNAYTVTWQTAAADDGHVSKGTFKFTLKQAH
jgi:methionine-rich copper-binding protein CopC